MDADPDDGVRAANDLRGEAALELGGVRYLLRPSYEAIVEAEKQAGSTIAAMAMAASNLVLPLASMAIVATEFIRAGGRASDNASTAHVGARRIGELILDAGVLAISIQLAQVLTDATTGRYTPAGEAKAARTTADPSSAA